MKYESSILKRLIDTYGVIGNPRYLSEIIKGFIVRGKELYPQLFTYQSDWLAHIDEFGLTPEYTVSYTGQHIYAPNTKEKPVKRAILSGCTLVNISMINKFSLTDGNKIARTYGKMIYGKKYLQIIAITKNTMTNPGGNDIAQINAYEYNSGHNFDVEDTIASGFIGVKKLIGMASKNGKRHDTSLRTYTNSVGMLEGYEMLIEYHDGMENWDIPYFEGMQSVRMPVLTTSNEDGTKTNILSTSDDVVLHGIGDVQDTLDCLTGEVVQNIGEIVLDGSEDEEWTISVSNSNFPNVLRMYLSNATDNSVIKNMKENSSLICDKFKVAKYADEPSIYITNGIDLHIPISTNSTIQQAREWLQQNQLTVQYELKTPSIKTVDLTIKDQNDVEVSQLSSFNGGTHFSTSSQEGSLLPSLIVDVVTNLEETLAVCSLEGNTM